MISGSGWLNMRVGLLGICAFGVLVGAGPVPDETPAVPPEEREGVIFERQQTMLQLERDGEVLGKIVAGTLPSDGLAQVTRSIANGAKDAVENYRLKVPGGRSKPEVWSNYPDFVDRMERFARNADAMAKAGATGNVIAVTGLMIDGMPCKQCHDVYREPKKP